MNRGHFVGLCCCLIGLPLFMGAKPAKTRLFKNAETVELFSAIEAGELEVKLVPKDATQSTVLVKNLTKKPLRIQMPAAFAGVPVLAQDDFGGGGGDFGGGGGDFGNNNNQQQQAFGGGMGGMGGGMGMGGMGMGGGMFNVAPERVHKVKVNTVCLEHGKKDPNPRVAYELRPIQAFTTNPHVHEVCTMLGRGEIDQVSAQAAAWHLTDKLNWHQLARKIKVKHLNGTVEMYFSPLNMRRAMKIVQVAKQRAAKRAKQKSPGEEVAQKSTDNKTL